MKTPLLMVVFLLALPLCGPEFQAMGAGAFYFETGKALYQASQYKQALDYLRKSRKAGEVEPKRVLYLAMTLGRLRRWKEVLVLLPPYLNDHPKAEEGWYWLGAARFYERRFKEAESSLRTALKLRPEDSDAHRVLGLVELLSDKPNEAYRRWVEALKLNPKDHKAAYFIGRLYYRSNVFAEAEKWLRYALTLAPTDYKTLFYLGLSREARDANAEAMDLYRRSIDESKKQGEPFSWAYSTLGVALRKQGQLDEALEVIEEGSRLAPDARVLTVYGKLLAARGEPRRAEAALRKAIELDADFSEPHYHLARLLVNAKRRDEAKQEFDVFRKLKQKEKQARLGTVREQLAKKTDAPFTHN